MKIKKRILSMLLAFCLVAGLMPTAAFAAETDTGKAAIQLVDSGTAANIGGGQADNIYFGTYKQSSDGSGGYNTDLIRWRVLSNADGKLFLLSDQNLDVFEYHKEKESVTWETSTIRSWLNGLADNKGDGDNAIDYTNDNFLDTAFSAKDQTAIADTTDKVFLLSLAEVQNTAYGFTSDGGNTDTRKATNTAYVAGGGKTVASDMGNVGEGGRWWLRSPGDFSNQNAANVADTGGLHSWGHDVNTANIAVRPAFNLNLHSVLFTSAADNTGHNDRFAAPAEYSGNEWKVTLKDDNDFSSNASVSGTTALTVGYAETTLTINHAALSILSSDYTNVTAMLTDSSNNILYYGSISNDTSATSSTVTIPAGLAAGDYTLSVYGEQWNGAYKTDYATGTPFITTITVSAPHTHSLAYRYSDDTGHWQECSDTSCPDTDKGKTTTEAHSYDNDTDATCDTCGYTRTITPEHTHSLAYRYSDGTGHWQECSDASCPDTDKGKTATTAHSYDDDTDTSCDTCGYTRTIDSGGSDPDPHSHSGGTATCQSPATCSGCGQTYGNTNSSNHTGGTEVRGKVDATATTAGYTGDTYCLGCNTKIKTGTTIPATGSGGGGTGGGTGTVTPTPTPATDNDEDTPVPPAPVTPTNQPTTTESDGWTEIEDEIGNTPPGGTVHVDMNGASVVPGEIWNEIAGKDITVEFDIGGGLKWTVNGKDIPTGGNLSDLNLGISTTANTIPVDIINNITGERYTMQLTLSHNGEFGFRLYLIVDVGLESAGYWANLYHYNTGRNSLDFMAAERIDSSGKAALPFDHASSYAVVIDTESHAPTSPTTGDTEYITYTVQKGDTLWAISRKYGCTVADIVAANSGLIKDPDLILVGWQLKIPQAGATGTNTPDAILPDDKKTTVYIVKRGDTLWAISRKYGCTVEVIVALNGELIDDPDLIFAGWELKVPQE